MWGLSPLCTALAVPDIENLLYSLMGNVGRDRVVVWVTGGEFHAGLAVYVCVPKSWFVAGIREGLSNPMHPLLGRQFLQVVSPIVVPLVVIL